MLTGRSYASVVNAYYDGLFNGIECNDSMYLILNIGKANGLADRVVLVNAGLGVADGEVCADFGDVEGYSVFRPGGRCDVKVRMYTLRTLIKEFEVEEGSALKMDCEGVNARRC